MIRRPASSSAGAAPPPIRRRPPPKAQTWNRVLWGLGFAIAIGVVVYLTWSVLSVLLASAALAYLLDPLVTRLERRGYTRDWGILILLVLGVALATTAGLVLVPGVYKQSAELAHNFVPYLDALADKVSPLVVQVEQRFNVDIPLDLRELGRNAPDYLRQMSPDMRAKVQAILASIGTGSLQVLLAVLSVTLMPVFVFYLLRDWPKIVTGVGELVPPRHRPLVRMLALEIDGRIGAWVRGQLVVAMILGCFYSVGLLISGIDLALTMGILSGALFLLPYIGPWSAAMVSILLALLKFGFDWHLAVVIGTYGLGQVVENTFLTPLLVGDRVGLHPMVVIVALIVAGNLLGIWGLVIALPLTAAIDVLASHVLARYRQSRTYNG